VKVLGKGSFGSVIECVDHKENESVAIKLLRDTSKLHPSIVFEVDLLRTLQGDDSHIIRYVDGFAFRGFFCIVMELVSVDLFSALRLQRFAGFPMSTVQMVARDVAIALEHTHGHGIIHADIKPENILFGDSEHQSCKVIDFGCSCYVGKLLFSYIQSRFYRAPEVILGFEYGTAIDIWSLGCVLCELVTGQPIFPAEDETELLLMIAEVIGVPPRELAKGAPRAKHHFDTDGEMRIKPNSKGKYHTPGTSSIGTAIKVYDRAFIELIEGCLRWNPEIRFTAEDVLSSEWLLRPLPDKVQPPPATRASARRLQ
jgi:dual specificity tyrosine-phosphorylation-regulated kinase 2/3/4